MVINVRPVLFDGRVYVRVFGRMKRGHLRNAGKLVGGGNMKIHNNSVCSAGQLLQKSLMVSLLPRR